MLNLTNLKLELDELKEKDNIKIAYPETVKLLKLSVQVLEILKEIQVIEVD